MDFGITGKRVLVTGASQGIGKAIAVAFAKEGCRVAVVARTRNKLKDVVNEIGGHTKGHDFYAVDLLKKGAPARTVRELARRGGNFDIIVHNIGGTFRLHNPLMSSEEWIRVWRLNMGIALDINRIAIPLMRQKKWGRIIHISSNAAEHFNGSVPYITAKACLNAYTKVLGKIFAKDHIVISALMPGAVNSPGGVWDKNSGFNRKYPKVFAKKESDFVRHLAIGRFATPEEIAPFAVFMASQHAVFASSSIISIEAGGSLNRLYRGNSFHGK